MCCGAIGRSVRRSPDLHRRRPRPERLPPRQLQPQPRRPRQPPLRRTCPRAFPIWQEVAQAVPRFGVNLLFNVPRRRSPIVAVPVPIRAVVLKSAHLKTVALCESNPRHWGVVREEFKREALGNAPLAAKQPSQAARIIAEFGAARTWPPCPTGKGEETECLYSGSAALKREGLGERSELPLHPPMRDARLLEDIANRRVAILQLETFRRHLRMQNRMPIAALACDAHQEEQALAPDAVDAKVRQHRHLPILPSSSCVTKRPLVTPSKGR